MTIQEIKELNNNEVYVLQDMILISRSDFQVILSGKIYGYCHSSISFDLKKYDDKKRLQILVYNFEIQEI